MIIILILILILILRLRDSSLNLLMFRRSCVAKKTDHMLRLLEVFVKRIKNLPAGTRYFERKRKKRRVS